MKFLISLAALLWTLPLCAQVPGWSPTEVSRADVVASSFTAQTAVFDSTDHLAITNSTGLSGLSDAKTFTLSCWIKPTARDGAQRDFFNCMLSSGNTRLAVVLHTDNTVRIFGRNASGTTILDMNGSTAITSSSGWTHIFVCINLANTSNRKIYVNGVADTLTVTTYLNDTLDLATGADGVYRVASQPAAVSVFTGSLAELWLNNTYSDSPSSFASGGHPIVPPAGADVYLSTNGSGSSWATDSSGNGNNFTVNGTLGTDTPP